MRGHNNLIENIDIDDCLFGIDLKQSNKTVLRGNRIRSKPFDLGVRGDGMRLWYSNDNLIENNQITDSRDMVAWYSHRNIFRGNVGRRSRYSIHFMFANDNIVEDNRFIDNAVGVYFMYTEGGAARNNLISHATGATGMALGFKEASNIDLENNEIIYCAVGVGSDLSPFQPDTTIRFKGNRFAYNGIAVKIISDLRRQHFSRQYLRRQPDRPRAGRSHRKRAQRLERQLLRHLPGFRPQRRRCGRYAPRELCLCRPDLDGNSASTLLQERRRCWNCSIFSNGWRPSPRRICSSRTPRPASTAPARAAIGSTS